MFTDFSIAEEQYDAQASGTEANRTMYPSPASLLLASGASEESVVAFFLGLRVRLALAMSLSSTSLVTAPGVYVVSFVVGLVL